MNHLSQSFLETIIRQAHKTAVSDPTGQMTFTEVFVGAGALSQLVESRTRRERVGLLLPTCNGFAVAFWAVLFADKTPVPLLPVLKPEELGAIAADAGFDLVLSIKPLDALARSTCDQVVLLDELPDGAPQGDFHLRDDFDNEVAALLYTSGSTGEPKGVELSHANLLANAEGCVRALNIDETFKILSPLPLAHAFALTTGFVLPFHAGASAIYLPRFAATDMLDLIERDRPNVVFAVPALYRVLVDVLRKSPDQYNLSSLAYVISGGAALPRRLGEAFEDLTGLPLLEGYGLTEASPVVSVNTPKALRRGSVGRPFYNVGVKIIDDAGTELPLGSEGEVCVSGPAVMRGYHGLRDETRQAVDTDGWLHTGDLGLVDEDEFLLITGRRKELIVSAGENIHPAEVQAAIESHDDVVESAVVGIPDPGRGEVPAAFVVLAEGASVSSSDIRTFCREHLASGKVPRKVVFIEALPKGPTGKVKTAVLKDSLSEPAAE